MSSTIPHYKVERVFEAPTLVTSISFSQDGLLLAAGFSNIARIWSIDSGRVAHNLVMDDEIVTVVWGPGNILYCGIASGYLVFKVIDNTNKEVRTSGFLASRKPVAFVSLDSSGLQLAVGGEDEVTIWKLGNLRDASSQRWVPEWNFFKEIPKPPTIQGHKVHVTSISWTTAMVGHIIVSYLHHGIITWNIEAVVPEAVSAINLATVACGHLSPDGQLFVSPNINRTFGVYNTDTGVHLENFVIDNEQQFEADQCPPALFIHNGKWLFGGGFGRATLWHMKTLMRIQTLLTDPASPITSVAANRRAFQGYVQNQIATVSNGPIITLWHAQGSVFGVKSNPAASVNRRLPSFMWAFILIFFACAIAAWRLSHAIA